MLQHRGVLNIMAKYLETSSAARGGKIREEHGRDNSNFQGGLKRPSFGGGVTNVSHSLSGSAKQGGNASKEKKNRFK